MAILLNIGLRYEAALLLGTTDDVGLLAQRRRPRNIKTMFVRCYDHLVEYHGT